MVAVVRLSMTVCLRAECVQVTILIDVVGCMLVTMHPLLQVL